MPATRLINPLIWEMIFPWRATSAKAPSAMAVMASGEDGRFITESGEMAPGRSCVKCSG